MGYDMIHDIIGRCLIRPSATFGSLHCGSGLAAKVPRLCCPDPALGSLSLRRSLLILSALAIVTIRGRMVSP